MLDVLKWLGPPGSLAFLLACVSIGAVLAFARVRRLYTRLWFGAVVALYSILSLPVVATQFIDELPPYQPVRDAGQNADIDVLVVLSGDNHMERAREAAGLVGQMKGGQVIVLGPDWFVRHLVNAGIPRERLLPDAGSRNTREQMAYVGRLAAARPYERIAVVASRLQMPRVAALATASGAAVLLRPSPTDPEPASGGWQSWIPQARVSRVTGDAMYEVFALAYYRRNGWIADVP